MTGYTLVVKSLDIGLDNEESFRKEIDILRECRHPNIVPYFGSVQQDNTVWVSSLLRIYLKAWFSSHSLSSLFSLVVSRFLWNTVSLVLLEI